MFRAPLCPSSGAHDDSVCLPHRPSGSRIAAGWKLSAGRMDECPDRRLAGFRPDTHPSCLRLTSNQQQLENQTACVVNKRYRRELLMMDIMVPETCSA